MKHVVLVLQTIVRKCCRGTARLVSSSIALAACLTACGGSSTDTVTPVDAGEDTGTVAQPDVGKILASPTPCTDANTVCVDVQMPSSFKSDPESLQVVLYFAAGAPLTPPDGLAAVINSPPVKPGDTVHLQASDAGLQGDVYMWAIMYMQGGAGYGRPVIGVDLGQKNDTAPKIHLDGSPVNVSDTLILGY